MDKERYERHLLLKEIGEQGQRKLQETSVLLVGAGGLGSPAALYLAAAGIGSLRIVDKDLVSKSNLQRQILYRTSQIGLAKAQEAAKTLRDLNPDTEICIETEFLNADNAIRLAKGVDIIFDACDNSAARYLMNDLSVGLGIPYLYASIEEFSAQIALFNTKESSATYRCLFPQADIKENKVNLKAGVLGCLPGFAACLQVNELIKYFCSFGEILEDKLLLADLKNLRFQKLSFPPSLKGREDSMIEFRKLSDKK